MILRKHLVVSSFVVLSIAASDITAQCNSDKDCPDDLVCENGKCVQYSTSGRDTIENATNETIGETSSEKNVEVVVSRAAYQGFTSGTQFITPGFLGYGNSLIGVEYEIGVNRFLGLQFGGGLIGAEFGALFHLLRNSNFDLHLIADGNVIFGLGVAPGISLGMRGLFGKAARAGLGGKIGVEFCTFEKEYTRNGVNYSYRPGQPLLIIGIGAPIRIH